MNSKNHVHPSKSFIVFDNPIERWRQMHDLYNGNYFISSEGRVMRITPNGIFKEVKKINPTNYSRHALVQICGDNPDKPNLMGVARLVLTYFKGGYYKGRRISYKNHNRLDVTLKNLYWSCGFDTKVDYEYLKKLKPHTLHSDDVKIVDYFFSKDVQILFTLVENYRNKLYTALHNKGLVYDVKNNIATLVLNLVDLLDKGMYKPYSRYVHYKTQSFLLFLINETLREASKELKHVFTDNEFFLDLKYLQTA